jgi:hypothetical protein
MLIKKFIAVASIVDFMFNFCLIIFWMYSINFELGDKIMANSRYVSATLDQLIISQLLSFLVLVYVILSTAMWSYVKTVFKLNIAYSYFSLLFVILYILFNMITKSENAIIHYTLLLFLSLYQLYNISFLHFKNWNKIFPTNTGN